MVSANSSSNFILSIERSTAFGLEKKTITFSKDFVQITKNTNFFDPKSEKLEIGLFKSENTDQLTSNRKYFETSISKYDLKSLRDRTLRKRGPSHSGTIYANDIRVDNTFMIYERLALFINEVESISPFEATDTVQLVIKSGVVVGATRTGGKQVSVSCFDHRCEVKGFGNIYR